MKDHALQWAAAGWRVFPVKAGGKTPLTAHGFKDATCNKMEVDCLWAVRGFANIGLATGGGLVVLDVDRKDGKDGFKALEAVGLSESVLDGLNTYSVDTPSGGRHYFFRSSSEVQSSAGVLGRGSGVDVRGAGGYVVVPPSTVDGKPYRVRDAQFHGEVPALDALADWEEVAPYLRKPTEAPPAVERVRPAAPPTAAGSSVLDRARDYLSHCDAAVSGQGGHDTTYRVASALVNGFDLPAEDAFNLIANEYNHRCKPPWNDAELRHKVADAAKNGPPSGKVRGWLLDGGGEFVRSGTATASAPPLPVVEVAEETEEDAGEDASIEDVELVPLPPGIVGKTAAWIEERCVKPFRPAASLAALVFWSALVARRTRYENQTGVLYGGYITMSHNGKNDPLEMVSNLLDEAGVSSIHVCSRFSSRNASVECFQKCLFHPVLLAIIDEAAGFFSLATQSDYGIADFLKEAWSSSLKMLYPQSRVSTAGKMELRPVHNPALSMLLAAQPSTLGAATSEDQLTDGLLPRVLWVVRRKYETERATANLKKSRKLNDTEDGKAIKRRARTIWNWFRGQADNEFMDMADLESRPDPYARAARAKKDAKGKAKKKAGEAKAEEGAEVDEPILNPAHEVWHEPLELEAGPGVEDVFSDFEAFSEQRVAPAAEGRASPRGYLWGKAVENAKRVAVVLAMARCGASPGPYTIEAEEARWAVRFVKSSIQSGVEWIRDYMAGTPFQRLCNKVLNHLKACGGVLKQSEITRALRIPARFQQDVLDQLQNAGQIERVTIKTKGCPATGYRLTVRRK